MSLEKVADIKQPCLDPGHNPPSMISLPAGVYRHTCPSCGQQSTFTIYGTIC